MNPSLLRNPRVVAAVLLGLVAVIVLNVKTFAPRQGLFRRAADPMADHLAPPADLDEVVRGAVAGDNKTRQFAVAGASPGLGLSRDPFSGNKTHRAPTTAAGG